MRNRSSLVGALLASALSGAAALAQNDFLTPYGQPQNAGDDTIAAGLALGFSFTMPDGTVVNAIDVDSNGRILAPGADASDYSDDLAEFLSEPHASICAQWSDTTLTSPADDVYFYTDNVGSAWITWNDARQLGGSQLYTFQIQLHAATPTSPQRTVFVYDQRVPANSCLVGITPGNGAADPGPSDFSAATTIPIVTAGVGTVYEAFTSGFDMQSTAFEFTEDGIGGWIVLANPISLPPVATNEVLGNCMRSLTFSPDSTGGYVVAESGGILDPVYGRDTGLHLDDLLSGPIDLGFPFPFPGGITTQFVNIDTNGRIVPDGSGAAYDWSPTTAEFFGNSYPTIAFWADFTPASRGAIRINSLPGVSATITWDGVPQLSSTSDNTFQFQLFADGTVIMTFAATSRLNLDMPASSTDDLIVGLSAGYGASDPGETDFSAVSGAFATLGVPNVYEHFDDSIPEPYDLQTGSVLLADTKPVPGAMWTLRVVGLPPSATVVKFLFGFVPLNFDLGLLGLGFTPGCQLLLEPQIVADGTIAAGGGASAQFNVSLPASSMIGLEAYVQAVNDGGFAPGFPTEFSTGIKGTVGL